VPHEVVVEAEDGAENGLRTVDADLKDGGLRLSGHGTSFQYIR
jgi:hypothetical protein